MNGIPAKVLLVLAMGLALASPLLAQSADRFPRPEFANGYKEPSVTQPTPRSVIMEWVDVGVLILALSAAAYYSLKRVSRKAIFILSVAAVLYFGFYREGCVCPIGSIQNVAQGIGGSSYGFSEKLLNRVYCELHCSLISPVGPLRCLAKINRPCPAMPSSSAFSRVW